MNLKKEDIRSYVNEKFSWTNIYLNYRNTILNWPGVDLIIIYHLYSFLQPGQENIFWITVTRDLYNRIKNNEIS